MDIMVGITNRTLPMQTREASGLYILSIYDIPAIVTLTARHGC